MENNTGYYYSYTFPIGQTYICNDNIGITQICLKQNSRISNLYVEKETEIIKKAYVQLQEYFNGKRKQFDLPLNLQGTEFQIQVWNELMKISYGQTCSYKEIAQNVQCPKGSRAVGMANNQNNIMIVIPCHRVIGSNGNLVGYAGGIGVKKYLLDLEKDNKE